MSADSATTQTPTRRPQVYVDPGGDDLLLEAVRAGGADVVADPARADALVWSDKDVEALQRALHPGIRWVQLPDAGVERWLDAGVVTSDPVCTSARGCYGPQVAEHALALLLAAARRIPACVRLDRWPATEPPTGTSLRDSVVVVVGAGDIGVSLVHMLGPLGAEVVAVTRSGRDVAGASQSVASAELAHVLPRADFVVLAAPSTAQTRRMIDKQALATMKPTAWLVNVGRGDLVDTDALVAAVEGGEIGGAAVDVTDPEPLPADHRLWTMDQVLITPHVANPPRLKAASLAERVRENTERFRDGRALVGVVDPAKGY